MKKKIGLVIQGPITTTHNKTKKYYDSNHNIKKILKDYSNLISEIVLVTWKKEKKKICKKILKNKNLKVLLLNDPGVPKLYSKDISDNRLRQFYSCYHGLKVLSDDIDIVIKTRTDLYIDLKRAINFFLIEHERKKKLLKSKFEGVICSKRFYITMPYWLSDQFYIGNKSILKNFFYAQIKYKRERFGLVNVGLPESDSVLKFLYFNKKKIRNFRENNYFPNLPKKLEYSRCAFWEKEFSLWQYSIKQYFSILPYDVTKSCIFKGEKYFKYFKYKTYDHKYLIQAEKNYINLLKKISYQLNTFVILKSNIYFINFNYIQRKFENKFKVNIFGLFTFINKLNYYYRKVFFIIKKS